MSYDLLADLELILALRLHLAKYHTVHSGVCSLIRDLPTKVCQCPNFLQKLCTVVTSCSSLTG